MWREKGSDMAVGARALTDISILRPFLKGFIDETM
jgi:hypothetical protein